MVFMETTAKQCKTCKETKDVGEFHKSTVCKDGREGSCKNCKSARQRARREADPEAVRAIEKKYRTNNPDAVRAKGRRWRQANPERQRENNRTWYANNRERRDALAREWKAANPHKVSGYVQQHRALKAGAIFGDVDWAAAQTGYTVCYLCGEPLSGDIDVDHVIPLSRGGAHSMENLRPTHASCNRSKQYLTLDELPGYQGPILIGAWSVRPVTCRRRAATA